ncbi:MAG: hypothetical protein QOF60_2623 [Actinomycetota bacterium]|jgi:uncharacterized ferritin-like protein (DUF455 family)|nr:hypothetical protein [Actinomycetota bacterium]
MKKMLPVEELARDDRFFRSRFEDNFNDPRIGAQRQQGTFTKPEKFSPEERNAAEGARSLMHGIFMGEIQALEGAGRTCWDFNVGPGEDEAPFALKLDMARQCWDESRHVEISVKLNEWMGTDLGEFNENTFLYEAACNPDPVMRLTGVNRALEGLAIDVFNTMKSFGENCGDPVMEFCEDWMLADEVTHVKMGSDWLRKLTETNPERRQRALEFQRVVDKLFSLGGLRSDKDESPVKLARRFRELAGFTKEEIDDIADVSAEAANETLSRAAGA